MLTRMRRFVSIALCKRICTTLLHVHPPLLMQVIASMIAPKPAGHRSRFPARADVRATMEGHRDGPPSHRFRRPRPHWPGCRLAYVPAREPGGGRSGQPARRVAGAAWRAHLDAQPAALADGVECTAGRAPAVKAAPLQRTSV